MPNVCPSCNKPHNGKNPMCDKCAKSAGIPTKQEESKLICKKCKRPISGGNSNTKYCKKCKVIVQLDQQKSWRRKHGIGAITKKSPPPIQPETVTLTGDQVLQLLIANGVLTTGQIEACCKKLETDLNLLRNLKCKSFSEKGKESNDHSTNKSQPG
jgi:hypothetical protein